MCKTLSEGRASLLFDDLRTVTTEIEAVLNSRSLSYVSSEDLAEPITPSHLLLGHRVLSLPDPIVSDDVDYNESPRDIITRRMKHLLNLSQHFWRRWKKEYLIELRDFHRFKVAGALFMNIHKIL